MSKKKKYQKDEKTPDKGDSLSYTKETKSPEDKKTEKGKDAPIDTTVVINFIKAVVFLSFLFLMWTIIAGNTEGIYCELYIFGFATMGFSIAFLSRALVRSGYFQYYRIIALISFISVMFLVTTFRSMDIFTLSLMSIWGIGIAVASMLPIYFEKIEVIKSAEIAAGVVAILLIGYVLYADKTMTRIARSGSFPMVYPLGLKFDPENKVLWSYGFENLAVKKPQEPFKLTIRTQDSPDEFRIKTAKKTWIEQNQALHRGKKPAKNKENQPTPTGSAEPTPTNTGSAEPTPTNTGSAEPTPTNTGSAEPTPTNTGSAETGEKGKQENPPLPFFEVEGMSISLSPAVNKNIIAVAVGEGKDKNNYISLINLSDMKETPIYSGQDIYPRFPARSYSSPSYSTWNKSEDKFFFTDKDNNLYVAELSGEYKKVSDKVISALWFGDELYLVYGDRKEDKENKQEINNSLDWFYCGDIQGETRVMKWNPDTTSTHEIKTLPADVKKVIAFPPTGTLLTFNGESMSVIQLETGIDSSVSFKDIPDNGSWEISPTGSLLAWKNDQGINIMELGTPDKKSRIIKKTQHQVKDLTFSSDEKRLVYTIYSPINFLSFFTRIEVWDLEKETVSSITLNQMTASQRGFAQVYAPYYANPYDNEIYFEEVYQPLSFTARNFMIDLWAIQPVRNFEYQPTQ